MPTGRESVILMPALLAQWAVYRSAANAFELSAISVVSTGVGGSTYGLQSYAVREPF